MKRILATLTIATLATSAAFAAKSNTEYYFQPAAGAHAVELKYNMNVMPRQTESATGVVADDKHEMNMFNLGYAYGLSDSNTLGLYLTTGGDKHTVGTTATTTSGLGDIHLFYEGSADMWHYGADLGIATEKIKTDTTTGTQNNNSTGGHSVKAFVGWMANSSVWNYGADLSYLMMMEKSVDNSDLKITGGNILRLAPFAEYNYGMGFLGAELSYSMSDNSKAKLGSVEATTKGETVTGLNLYGSFDFNAMTTGLLTLGTNMHGAHDQTDVATAGKVKGYTETVASLGVRLNF